MLRPLAIGNWKMALSHKGELELARALKRQLKGFRGEVDIVVCPSFPSLAPISELLKKSPLAVGAQNVHEKDSGAFTGSVSVSQIAPFVEWCIIGHSEARQAMGITDKQVQQQAAQLLARGITPVMCLGETLAEREADQTMARITEQTQVLLANMTRSNLAHIVLAYEPIWAISEAAPAALPEPDDVAGVMLLIRKLAAGKFDSSSAERLRILYGGSVGRDTAAAFVGAPGVNGVLVGSASVQPRQFLEIIQLMAHAG